MSESPFSAIQFIAEKRIEEAMAQGEFDNLPGKGRPLDLEDDTFVPEDLRMAYKILRNANCLAPELEERKTINHILDLLENCSDEKERLAGMQKARFLVERSRIRYRRHIRLEEDDPYYSQVIQRLTKLKKNQS